MASPETCELAAASGFDFVIIDLEHGSFDLSDAVHMIRATESRGGRPVVRVPVNDPTWIGRVLDAGARGVIVPGVKDADDAREAVAAARYEPHGHRGACPCTRASDHGAMPWSTVAHANLHDTPVWLLIEQPDAVDNIDDILSAGPDGVMLGPFDLAVAMGFEGRHDDPVVMDALAHVLARAAHAGIDGIAVTVGATTEDAIASARHWASRGATHLTVLLDRLVLASAYSDSLSKLRGGDA